MLKKLFFHTKMTWLRVILMALCCGVIPGLLMVPGFLEFSSLQQPGISYEFWVLMAMLIALNCDKALEAGLKTFVFFLISQPIIYLVQVPFSSMGWELFQYYPRWGILTLFTLPGGMLAWYTKKGNYLSALLLAGVCGLLCVQIPALVRQMLNHFPLGTLAVLFDVAEIVFFPLLLLKKRPRYLALGLCLLALVFGLWQDHSVNAGGQGTYSIELADAGPYTVLPDYEGSGASVEGNTLSIVVDYYAYVDIGLTDGEGNEFTVSFSSTQDGAEWDVPEPYRPE